MVSVSLKQFIDDEKHRMELFEKWWLSEHKKNPVHFPMEMPDENAGVWFESWIDFDPNYTID